MKKPPKKTGEERLAEYAEMATRLKADREALPELHCETHNRKYREGWPCGGCVSDRLILAKGKVSSDESSS